MLASWQPADRRTETEIRGLDGTLVDLVATFRVPADPTLQGADGVHPTLAGQSAILHTLVERRAAATPARHETT